jgi:hypothetical protein
MKLATVCVLLAVGAGAFAAGWVARGGGQKAKPSEGLNLTQLDFGGARAPLWANPGRCRQANADEQRQHRVALEALQVFDADWLNALQRGAIKHFAYPSAQRRGASSGENRSLTCPPVELYDAVTKAAIKANVFGRPFLFEDAIGLAEQLGPRDPEIVDAVARSAFYDSVIPEDIFRADLRPYARLVLAEFGAAARKWAEQAMAQVSANDQLGTGAAQIAVAGGEPRALPEVQRLMAQILSATPEEKPIPYLSRSRIYELAFALGMAGEDAQPYAAPLIKLLGRTVESRAPPFGILQLPPARMCAVAEHIGGSVAVAAGTKAFCIQTPKAFEQ